jgi:hypothetical protein
MPFDRLGANGIIQSFFVQASDWCAARHGYMADNRAADYTLPVLMVRRDLMKNTL